MSEYLHHHLGWLVDLGVALVVLGIIAKSCARIIMQNG